jgi:hypothetical protein
MRFMDDVTPQNLEQAKSFSSFQIGDNTAHIVKVEEAMSSSGNNMLVIHFENEFNGIIRYYIVDNEYKFQKLKGLYQAFGIPFTETNPDRWIGRQGVVVCKEGKPYNGETRPEVHYVKPILSNTSSPAQPAMYSTPEQAPANQGWNNPPPSDDGFVDEIPF